MFGLFHRFHDALHRHPIDRIGELNGVLSAIALYPQVIQIFSTRSVVGLSAFTFWLIALNSAIWLIYATHRSVRPLAFSSLMNLTAAILILGALYAAPWR